MTQEFAGKTALITGGGTGIGRAAAVQLAAKGCIVTVAGRTISTLEETSKSLAEKPATSSATLRMKSP